MTREELQLAIDAGIRNALKDKAWEKAPKNKVGSSYDISDIEITLQLKLDKFSVGKDTDKKATYKPFWEEALVLLAKQVGYSDKDVPEAVVAVLEQVDKMDKGERAVLSKEMREAATVFTEKKIGTLPRTTVQKSVTVSKAKLTILDTKFG